jgi:hypothetical protein
MLGTHDVLFVTLDTLRYDVASIAWRENLTPNLRRVLPASGWERRHTPGSFTYAAHHAFFAGFLPTPTTPGPHPRLFAVAFPGSESIGPQTIVFNAPDIVTGFSQAGYRTICIGGVGFFNMRSPLGSVLPALFDESHWSEELGVTCRQSARNQVDLACERIAAMGDAQRVFVFLNVSALHQPNCIYVDGATVDTPATQAAALTDVDRHLPRLLAALQRRAPVLTILCSDHGTAYGEEGYTGHRLAHPVVWEVPYADFVLPRITEETA